MTKFMLFGEGSPKEQAFCEQCWRMGTDVDDLLCCINGPNFFLERATRTVRVDGIEHAIRLASARNIDIVILLGLEQFLAGNAEAFQDAGFQVFGLSRSTAFLENSKARSKSFMKRHGVTSADSVSFTNIAEAEVFLRNHWGEKQFVVKSSSDLDDVQFNCRIPENLNDAIVMVHSLWHHLGEVGAPCEIVIEERLEGREFSLHVLISGGNYRILPMVRDYKRLFKDDRGPNTAGIGSVATAIDWDISLLASIRSRIVEPTVEGFLQDGIDYRFILYIGVIVTEDGPVALEYNVRPGTPEFPALLALLRTNGLEMVSAVLEDQLDALNLEWNFEQPYSVAVTTTAPGYPFSWDGVGETIEGLGAIDSDVWALAEKVVATPAPVISSGRVLTMVACGSSFRNARERVYRNIDKIRYNGLYCRRDIGELEILE